MKKNLLVLSLIGALSSFSITAMADTLENSSSSEPKREDAVFFCKFRCGDELCKVFGQFDPIKPKKKEVIKGDCDDRLVVACSKERDDRDHDRDRDDGKKVIVYNDGIEWFLDRDRDDHGDILDTVFKGLGHKVPTILVEDLNWRKIAGSYKATLKLPENRESSKGECLFFTAKHHDGHDDDHGSIILP